MKLYDAATGVAAPLCPGAQHSCSGSPPSTMAVLAIGSRLDGETGFPLRVDTVQSK